MQTLKNIEVVGVRRLEGCGALKAFVDIRIGGVLVITQCAVLDGKRGLFVTMLRQMGRDGRWRDAVMVLDEDLKREWDTAILLAYEKEMAVA